MKKIIIFVILIIILPKNCFALVGSIQNGDSLSGKARIGYNNIGSGYYEFATNTSDSSDLGMNLTFEPTYKEASTSGTALYHFTVDFCTNGSMPELTITSYYSNFVDYVYSLGTHIYVANGDWARTNCFRAFVRLNLNYTTNYGTNPDTNFITLSNNANWFWVYANYGYNTLLRYQDMIYYSEESYNERLLQAQQYGSSNTIINQNDTIINQNNNINNSINNVDNTITDNSVDNPSSDISDFQNYLASNSTISSLLTLPITLFTKVLDSLNGTCASYDLGEFRGTHLILPCINISSYIGNTLFNVIDVLISGLFVYKISRKFVDVFEHMSSMKDGDILNG